MKIEKCLCCGNDFIVMGKHNLYCPECRDREVAKDNAIIENADEQDLLRLSCGVLEESSKTFNKLVAAWHNEYRDMQKKHLYDKLIDECKWWKSKNFEFWASGLDGKKVLKGLVKFTELEKITNFDGFEYEREVAENGNQMGMCQGDY